jgi:hypothetical protein
MTYDSNPTAFGVSDEVSTINPFTSSGGGQYGLNLEYTQDTGLHWYWYYTPGSWHSGGFMPGGSVTGNIAYGNGDWTGLFNNYGGKLGWASGGDFNSTDFTNGGYWGMNFGWGSVPRNWGESERYKLYICLPSALRVDVEHSAVCLAEICG